MSKTKRVLVTGAGGFIAHHLVKYLTDRGYWVRGVDIKEPEYEPTAAQEFELLDLRRYDNCLIATRGVTEVYGLAADMGGIGFIEHNKGVITRNNTLINLHTIEAARINGVARYLYTSSACIYPGYKQLNTDVTPLKETDAYPGGRRGRVWLGEALHGACLPALPRGFRSGDARGPVPQHFRALGHLRWRPREVARGDLPQSGAG